AAGESSKGAFDDPTAWKHHESSRPIGALEGFSFELRQGLCQGFLKVRPLIATHQQRAFSRKGTSRKGSQEAGCRHRDLGYRQDDGWRAVAHPAYLRDYGAASP